jgi:hypothetical protein
MAQNENEDFKDFMFKHIELQFPRLKETWRFNNAEKKSELCAATANGAAWSTGIKMPRATAKDFHAQMKAHYEECRKRDKKFPEFTRVFGMKKDEEAGTVTFEAKKRGVNGDGKANKPPTVIDNLKQPMASDKLDFWSGTTANVRVRAFPTIDPDGIGGISLLLDVVQVLKPKYGTANLDGFEEEEVEDNTDDVASKAHAGAAERKAASKPASDDEF